MRMYNCDEHALCLGCRQGERTYCRAVADFYGGAGVPYVYNGSHGGVDYWGGKYFVGSNAAFNAINHDWSFWCQEDVLTRIEQGTFNGTAEWVSYAAFTQVLSETTYHYDD